MKKIYFFFLLFNYILSVSFAQQMPLDFSESSDTFSVFGGSTFAIIPSPTDSNNPVGQFFRSNSSALQGHYIDLVQPIDLDVQNEVTLKFFAFDPNMHTIVVKLENGANPDIELNVQVSSQNVWTDLSFDFSTVGGEGAYGRLVIRIDDGSTIPGAFLIDNISDGSIPNNPNEIDVIYEDLVWFDEFDSTTPEALDSAKWYHQTFGPNNGQWFNGEEQHYTDRMDNSFVENGFLNIVAKSENFTQNGVTLDYTSARLNSKFAFTYGRVDVRAKLPFGEGTWPAIWTLGKNIIETGAYWQTQGYGTTTWPACGEIDIMEHGLHGLNEVNSAIHTPSSFGNTVNTSTQFLNDVANEFHVYSMNWSPDQITFLIDDVGYYTYNPTVKDANTWPFNEDQYLLLNIAMGGVSGNIDPSFLSSNMVIDYVRVYQNVLNVNDTSLLNELKIFPNPATTTIKMTSKEKINSVEIYNMLGQRIMKKIGNIKSIDTSNMTSGMYILKIKIKESVLTKRITIK